MSGVSQNYFFCSKLLDFDDLKNQVIVAKMREIQLNVFVYITEMYCGCAQQILCITLRLQKLGQPRQCKLIT